MVVLPDGDMIEMRWKSVSYIYGEKKILFTIVPMMNRPDYVMIPNTEQWIKYLAIEKRNEIIVILEKVNWKRDIQIVCWKKDLRKMQLRMSKSRRGILLQEA